VLIATVFILLWTRFVFVDGPTVTAPTGQLVTGLFTASVLSMIELHPSEFWRVLLVAFRWFTLVACSALLSIVSSVDTTLHALEDCPSSSYQLDYATLVSLLLILTIELSDVWTPTLIRQELAERLVAGEDDEC
jgi:hypothetical protein